MNLIDTHAHTYVPELLADASGVVERSVAGGLSRVLMPAIDSGTHQEMLDLEARHPSHYLSMMGLHPCSVKTDVEKELQLIEDYLTTRPFVGVGEIGLDFYWDLTFKEQQFQAFHHQIELALQYDLPVSIHSRNATADSIEVVRAHQKGRLRGVFHCFSGTAAEAGAATELGLYLGIGGVLTFKNSGLDKSLKDIPLENMVLETDAPYLAPAPYRGKRNEPSYLIYIAEKLAALKGVDSAEVAAITSENARKLFRL